MRPVIYADGEPADDAEPLIIFRASNPLLPELLSYAMLLAHDRGSRQAFVNITEARRTVLGWHLAP